MDGYTDEDLAGLTEAEREALKEPAAEGGEVVPQTDADEAQASEQPPADGQAEAQTDGEDQAEAEDQSAAEVAEDGPPQDEGQEVKAEPGQEPEPARHVPPRRLAPENATDQREALRAELDEHMRKLLDGEITQAEYAKENKRIQDNLDDITRKEAADLAVNEYQFNLKLNDWNRAKSEAIKMVQGIAGADTEKVMADAQRMLLGYVQVAQGLGYADVPGDIAASQRGLNMAINAALEMNGLSVKKTEAPEPQKTTPIAAAEKKPAGRPAPDRSKLPPTLAKAPVAQENSVQGEFAHLEGLKMGELEDAIAKMTPDQVERYLASA